MTEVFTVLEQPEGTQGLLPKAGLVQGVFKQDLLGKRPSRGRGLQPASTSSENPWGNRKDDQLSLKCLGESLRKSNYS